MPPSKQTQSRADEIAILQAIKAVNRLANRGLISEEFRKELHKMIVPDIGEMTHINGGRSDL